MNSERPQIILGFVLYRGDKCHRWGNRGQGYTQRAVLRLHMTVVRDLAAVQAQQKYSKVMTYVSISKAILKH